MRKGGEGEVAVGGGFPDAIVVRPAVMFGPDDAFLTPILALLRKLPVFPMFGRGLTRLQPVYVGDVAEAIAKALATPEKRAITFECGGAPSYFYLYAIAGGERGSPLPGRVGWRPLALWYSLSL